MNVFVNERSLEKHAKWGVALKVFWETALVLRGHAQLFRDSEYFIGEEFRAKFQSALAGTPPDIRSKAREVAFSDRYWRCWRPEKVSVDGEQFICEELSLVLNDDSLCEAAARKLPCGELAVGVVSAPDSTFAEHARLHVRKESTPERAELRNATSAATVQQWVAQEHGYYSPTSRVAPLDFQTVLLKEPDRFWKTGRLWHVAGRDRNIYREVETGNYYYVDEGHFGQSAHLEVFDSEGRHLGEADIVAGILNPGTRDPGKTIKL